MSRYNYGQFKILIDPDSRKVQGLQEGDVVCRQYLDGENLIYSLMVVLRTGIDILSDKTGKELRSPYFIGALLEGNEPETGELLDFIRVTNLFNANRSGALYLTASDAEAPYLDVIDGMATENTLCFPYMGTSTADQADSRKYGIAGTEFLTSEYRASVKDVYRVFRMTRNDVANPDRRIVGLKQILERKVANPQRIIISYKIRASRPLKDVELRFGYADEREIDGKDIICIGTGWEYKLSLITIDYPETYTRSLTIDLTAQLQKNDWCEIGELNLVLLSDIATFSNGTKARVGKIRGIVDPVFGFLDGYGAYFQNLYATKNVNIAGTLTAGDEKGYASTFYVGRIHKNCLINSLYGNFVQPVAIVPAEKAPAGIGDVFQLPAGSIGYKCQHEAWAVSHDKQKYCFSFWAKGKGCLSLLQNGRNLTDISIDETAGWRRCYISFVIEHQPGNDFVIEFECTAPVLFCSPQLEPGDLPTLYQATDNELKITDEYGAWFCQGGIGGTIQNPLLRLNPDGSIEAGNKSFVIHPDGTGYFAGGRFKWTEDTITLQDVTIRWEDFDEQTQESLLPKSVHLTGTDTFHYQDTFEETCEPSEITVVATEQNFNGTLQRWQYLATDGNWKDMGTGMMIRITPALPVWENRNVLTLQYVSLWNQTEFAETFTISKQYDGLDSYSVYITSSQGNIFRNGMISTTLTATLYQGGIDVTDKIPEHHFRWTRVGRNPEDDILWNEAAHTGKSLEVSAKDVLNKAVFDCEVTLSTT
ncbi:hypothetical protein DW228_06080 [Bacteroides fragilis]|uniref:Uncharacterized protein n=1 Tax=Bacteroides fragilis TaxID=817 RepID=A0A396C1J7_BACFG|nr:hypothetical protein [Bacteroides fragilis]RHH14365.1 hypothetical protein DW228_06080 [Bacteroides fragilis]